MGPVIVLSKVIPSQSRAFSCLARSKGVTLAAGATACSSARTPASCCTGASASSASTTSLICSRDTAQGSTQDAWQTPIRLEAGVVADVGWLGWHSWACDMKAYDGDGKQELAADVG
ncbi:hypothetical protein HaLaN_05214, partial [Haematococcus lacustris]